MSVDFSFEIRDVFVFEKGTTVMAGVVTDGPGYIPSGRYDLFLDGVAAGRVDVVGERISGGRPNDLRSVEAVSAPQLQPDLLRGHRAIFREAA